MACHISFRAVTYVPHEASVTITVHTDLPCHLWCRLSLEPPRIHKKAVIRRGEPFMSELRFCFTQFEDNEQEEAGDTYVHTFEKPDWPYCTTKYFYLYGYVAGTACPSTSPPFKYHNVYEAPEWVETTLFTGGGTDSFSLFIYETSWVWRTPWGYVYVGYHDATYRWGGGGFRFLSCPLNASSNVIEAKLYIKAYVHGLNDPTHSRIQVEDDVNPATFSTWANYGARTQLVPAIDWDDIEHFTQGEWYYSSDFAQLLNAVIIKPGWSSGNPVAVTWQDWDRRTPEGMGASRWTHGGTANPVTLGARLYLKYTP